MQDAKLKKNAAKRLTGENIDYDNTTAFACRREYSIRNRRQNRRQRGFAQSQNW
jgi:hypothetical protein